MDGWTKHHWEKGTCGTAPRASGAWATSAGGAGVSHMPRIPLPLRMPEVSYRSTVLPAGSGTTFPMVRWLSRVR